jgi:Ca2+-binding RTX toxin-like protein
MVCRNAGAATSLTAVTEATISTAVPGTIFIKGGDGGDTITAGNGSDTIDGDAGDDTIVLGAVLSRDFVKCGTSRSDQYGASAPQPGDSPAGDVTAT